MDQIVHRGAARSSGALGRFGALWDGAVRRTGSQLRSGSVLLWGVLGRSGALWGVLGHSGLYSGTECVVYTALPASLVSLYWFLQYIMGVLLNRGAKPTAPQSVWYMQHSRHQCSFCLGFYNTCRGAPKWGDDLCGICNTSGISAHF